MTGELPWFPLYVDDALNMRQRLMTSAERGMFWALCFNQWMEGGLPADTRALWKMSLEDDQGVFDVAWAGTLEPLFPTGSDGLRRNPKLEKVAAQQRKRTKQRSKIAKGAAEVRWKGVAEQKERDAKETEASAAVDAWLEAATSARRKAMLARARKKVATTLGPSNGNIGDTTRAHLERAALTLMLTELEEI